MRHLVLLSGFLSLILTAAGYAAIDPWYEQNPSCVIDRGNPARTGEYKTEPLTAKPVMAWNDFNKLAGLFSDGKPIYCYKNYVIGYGPAVLDKDTGKVIWSHFDKQPTQVKAMTVYKDYIYTVEDLSSLNIQQLAKYKISTGQKDVLVNLKVGQQYNPPLLYKDTMYISLGKGIAAFNINTGNKLWQFNLPLEQKQDLGITISTLSTDGEKLYFSNWKDTLYAVNLNTGKLVWSKYGVITAGNYLVPVNDILYVNGFSTPSKVKQGGIFAYNAKNGDQIGSGIITDQNLFSFAVNDNIIFAYKHKNIIYAFDTRSGKTLWSLSQQNLFSNPIVVGSYLYYLRLNNKYIEVTAVDKANGKIKWHYPLPNYEEPKFRNYHFIMPYQGKIYISGRASVALEPEPKKENRYAK